MSSFDFGFDFRHNSGRSGGGAPAYHPVSEFDGGKQGILLLANEPSTLFKNTARTDPVTAYGQSVLGFKDFSGRDNHLSNTTGPTYEQDANGNPVLRFNGTNQYLAGTLPLAQLGGNLDKTMIWAGKHASLSGNQAKASYGAAGGYFAPAHLGANRSIVQWGADVSQTGAATTNAEVWAAVKTGNTLTLYVNGVQVIAPTAVSAANIVSNIFELGRFNGATYFPGDFYGLLLIEGNPSLEAPTTYFAGLME